ncbi:MAG TPA: hypothetical protein VIU82_21975 [Bosea sp. (in: a-proteobacteria)]
MSADLARVERERDEARARVRELALLLDKQMGTPCEQIRHEQETTRLREALSSETAAREKAERRVAELESRYEDWKPIGEIPHESQIHRGVLFNFYRDDEDGTFWNGTWSQRRDADIWCSVVTASLNSQAHAALLGKEKL